MGFFDQLFPKKEINQSKLWQNPIQVELHSHLIPGVDDGVETLEQAAETIQLFANMGYKKIITTPHIMSDFYKNGAHNLLPLLAELKAFISEKGINVADFTGPPNEEMANKNVPAAENLKSFE